MSHIFYSALNIIGQILFVTHFPNITGLLTNAPAVPMLARLQASRRKAAAMGNREVIAVGLGKLFRQTLPGERQKKKLMSVLSVRLNLIFF